MNFLAPLAGLFGALSIPIILLYMLRLRRVEMQVSSNFLWRDLVRDREANAPWQRLRFSWLLLLQLLILVALVLALMRPFIEVETISAGRIVLLLDASASMNATDVENTRFEAAQNAALDVVETLGGGDEITLIRVADVPEVLLAGSSNRAELRRAIQDAEASQSSADWTAALTLAAAGGQGARDLDVVIVTDGGLPGGLPDIPGNIRLVTVGQSPENVAISALATRTRSGQAPQLFAQVTNYGSQDTAVIFDIRLDGELFDAQRYDVPAGQRIDIITNNLPDSFDSLTAGLSEPAAVNVPDYLALDNQAYTVQSESGAGRVLLITERNIFLNQIFNSLSGVQLTTATPAQGLPAETFDLTVLDGWLPPQLPQGDLFIINPPSSTPLFTLTGTAEDINLARVTRTEAGHPVTNYLDFSQVNIRAFQQLDGFGAWGNTLIQAEGGPLLIAGEENGRQIAILSFALQDSDLPLQLAWPILVANLTQWYTPARILNAPDGLTPGETITIRSLRGEQVRIHQPNGHEETFALNDSGALIYAQTTQAGFYRVEVLEGDNVIVTDRFAVNMFDPQESRIAPVESVTLGTTTVTEAAREEKGQRELWEYLALLGLLILLIEWLYYHRASWRVRLSQWQGQAQPRSVGGRIR